MRHARVQDYWEKAYKRAYADHFVEVDMNGLNSIPRFDVPKGLMVICGLNGAGKSTIISAFKDVVGLPLTEYDVYKLNKNSIHALFVKNGAELNCSNSPTNRLVDSGWDSQKLRYIDCTGSSNAQNYTVKQSNLDEFLEQFEEFELSPDAIDDLNYLTGKRYSVCGIRELEDIEDLGTIPFFRVVVDGTEYDSRSMGNGEHFLFYLFWCINAVSEGTILIVEEPETYVSISSQIHFSDYLGKQIATKGITVILTTHSPYILNNIKNDNIRIVSRMGNVVSIISPNESMSAESILGISCNNIGTFFVEDRVAADFMTILLEDKAPHILKKYTIDVVGGEAEISKRLEFPKSDKIQYNFVGVYDGDMKKRLNTQKLKWKYCFLPGEKALEEVLREYLHQGDNASRLCAHLEKDLEYVIAQLAAIDGLDYHDWFEELRKFLVIDGKSLIRAFYSIMKDNYTEFDLFMDELKICLDI